MKTFFYRFVRALLLIALPALVFYVSTVLYVLDHMEGSPFVAADCAIIFGTAVRPVYGEDGTITSAIAGPGIDRRVSTAADLFREGRVHRLFLTGGEGEGNPVSEAQVMRRYAIANGIPAGRMTLEERSRSTWENLLYTRPLTSDCESVVAISDHYHIPRIALYAHAQGWSLPVIPATKRSPLLFTARNVLREALGIDWLVLLQLLT